jgi:phytoene dehydrogenase-like protein
MTSEWVEKSKKVIGKIIGNYSENIVYEDSFTPVTIERYTSRSQGAVYGSPEKQYTAVRKKSRTEKQTLRTFILPEPTRDTWG